jgi:demethylmenaquinone methyltransferase/2-methoxy-6-polyprenyl-1,4-benzoquinol methylase
MVNAPRPIHSFVSTVTTRSYYEPGTRRAERVRTLFDRIASRYDLINDLQSVGLHRLWKRRLIRLATRSPDGPSLSPGSDPGPTVATWGEGLRERDLALDVCCGTGDIACSLAAHGARVVGLDFSAPMLAIAQQRVRSESQPDRVHLVRGDALRLPFPENRFGVVTIGYGLRNLASCEDGLRELLRVLRPGGRLLILDFGKPDNAVWRSVYFGYLRVVVPLFGLLFCGDYQAYAYILES